jgi:rubrerythrin
MVEEVVRCLYCVLGDQFRAMLQRPEWFICEHCGHVVLPEDPGFRCSCGRCLELNQAA